MEVAQNLKLMFTEEQLLQRIQNLANELNHDLAQDVLSSQEKPLFLTVLKGAFTFSEHLLSRIDFNYDQASIQVASYNDLGKRGQIRIIQNCELNLSGRDIIVLEDIIDSGATIRFLKEYLAQKSINSVKLCSLFERKNIDLADYVAFKLDDEFVVGFGLDFGGLYRELSYVASIELINERCE